jgi:hypothetical protein
MRQGFLGLASLAGHGSGIRPHRAHGATVGRDGSDNGGGAAGGHEFGLHRINLNVFIHN